MLSIYQWGKVAECMHMIVHADMLRLNTLKHLNSPISTKIQELPRPPSHHPAEGIKEVRVG